MFFVLLKNSLGSNRFNPEGVLYGLGVKDGTEVDELVPTALTERNLICE